MTLWIPFSLNVLQLPKLRVTNAVFMKMTLNNLMKNLGLSIQYQY
jgi:hypothetical protein